MGLAQNYTMLAGIIELTNQYKKLRMYMDCRCRGAIRRKKKTSRQALPDSTLIVVTFYNLSSAIIHPMLDQVLI